MYKSLVIGIVFLLGLYFISQSNKVETFTTEVSTNDDTPKIAENCPDVLIKKGSALFLYNSKRAGVAGINPIRFENLDEYTEFVEWQHSQGILCPILFLQHAYNAQGEAVYKAHPSPTNLQGGLPDFYVTNKIANPNMMPPPSTAVPIQGLLANTTCGDIFAETNKRLEIASEIPKAATNYTGFDAHAQYGGMDTAPLDKLFNETNHKVSPNPMDDNWGGIQYTQYLINSGYYADNEVSKAPFNFSMTTH